MEFKKGDRLFVNPLKLKLAKKEHPWVYKVGGFHKVIFEAYDSHYDAGLVSYRRTPNHPLEQYMFSRKNLEKYFIKDLKIINLKNYVKF